MKISVQQLNSDFEKGLVKVLKANKGQTPLSLVIVDPDKKASVEFAVKKFSVTISTDFIDALKDLGVSISVKKKTA